MIIKIMLTTGILLAGLAQAQISYADEANTDSRISAAVENKISSNTSLHDASIKAKTSNGVVSLSGDVKSNEQANTATELAQSTQGVRDVDTSDLTIGGSQHLFSDAVITSKVKGMFLQQKLFGDKDVAAMTISVETTDGAVVLSGTADNQQQIANAMKIAKSVSGVKSVKSNVKISN